MVARTAVDISTLSNGESNENAEIGEIIGEIGDDGMNNMR